MTQTVSLGLPLFGAGLCAAALSDVRVRRVPNWLNVWLLALGLGLSLCDGGYAALSSLLGALSGLALLFVPFGRRWIGGGDVKLLAAVGAWLGPLGTLHCALLGAIFGGAIAVGLLLSGEAAHRRAVLTNLRLALLIRGLPTVEERPAAASPPYAVAISLGAALTVALLGLEGGLVVPV